VAISRPRLGHSLRPPDPLAHPGTANPARLRWSYAQGTLLHRL